MEEKVRYGILLDFYGAALSERQRDIMQLYYGEDLSFGEIAQDLAISKQGVYDAVQKAKMIIEDLEQKLHFMQRFFDLNQGLKSLQKAAQNDKAILKEIETIRTQCEVIDYGI